MAPPWEYVFTFVGLKGGRWASWWGGFGGVGLVTGSGVGAFLHLLNCHEQPCKRVGRYTTIEGSGHHYRRCRKHHTERHKNALNQSISGEAHN